MSIPSFSSFPQRNPPKPAAAPPPASSFPGRTSLSLGNDESSIAVAGPSFSSFPRRPSKLEETESGPSHESTQEGVVKARADSRSRPKEKDKERDRDKKRRIRDYSDKDRVLDRDLEHRRLHRDRNDDDEIENPGDRYESRSSKSKSKSDEKSRKRSRSRSRSRDRHHDRYSRKRDRDKDRDRHSTQPDALKFKHAPTEGEDKLALDPKEFYMDTKGDEDILRFGPQRGMRYIPVGRKCSFHPHSCSPFAASRKRVDPHEKKFIDPCGLILVSY